MDDTVRAELEARLPEGWIAPRAEPDPYSRRLWIVADGRPAGTLALGSSLGGSMLRLHSLYVDPDRRGRGRGARALDAAERAGHVAGLDGISLETEWTWFLPARWYSHDLRFWVRSWKRSLRFWRGHQPPPELTLGEDAATLAVGGRVLIRAGREGDRLGWDEVGDLGDWRYDAPGTLAVALACAGWPLIRSDEALEHAYERELDFGGPEPPPAPRGGRSARRASPVSSPPSPSCSGN